MLRPCAVLFVAASVVVAEPAFAAIGGAPDDSTWESGYDPGKQKRRSDFTAGAALGIGFGSASGYPNEVAKMNDPRYLADTGFGGGNASSFWLGVAFRDWFVFGFGLHPYTIQSSKCPALVGSGSAPDGCTASFGAAFMLHIEAFPFFYQSPALQNLGIFTEMGAGPRSIESGTKISSGETVVRTVAEGGAMAFLSLGIVYEPIRLWDHLSMGPYIQGSHEFSETLRANQIILGFRAVYYGGP